MQHRSRWKPLKMLFIKEEKVFFAYPDLKSSHAIPFQAYPVMYKMGILEQQ